MLNFITYNCKFVSSDPLHPIPPPMSPLLTTNLMSFSITLLSLKYNRPILC